MYFSSIVNLIMIKFYEIKNNNINIDVFDIFFNVNKFDEFFNINDVVNNVNDNNNLTVKKIN